MTNRDSELLTIAGEEVSAAKDAQPLPVQTTIRPLTDEEVERGGEPFAPSWPLICEAREERERRP